MLSRIKHLSACLRRAAKYIVLLSSVPATSASVVGLPYALAPRDSCPSVSGDMARRAAGELKGGQIMMYKR